MSDTLFELPPSKPPQGDAPAKGRPRLRTPNRSQIEMRAVDLEGLLPPDHKARVVWDYVEGLDLSRLYDAIEAVEGGPGRSATDPRILMALWLYATLEGVGSARALDRLTRKHDAYRWICGGVSVNYHTVSDFRVDHMVLLDELLTTSVATLSAEGLVEMTRVAQDGMRVRASAGAASFRRKETLEQHLKDAEEQVAALRKELDEDPAATSRRQKAARERAAKERLRRVAAALKRIPEAEAKKKKKDKDKARVSTTDPEATVMKMGDGGFRPAFNAQYATDTPSQVIVGVEVIPLGSDQGLLAPMVEQLHSRYGYVPDEMLVDGGFVNLSGIEEVTERGCTVYAPVPKPSKESKRDPHSPLPTDSPIIASWRQRMGTDEAKAIYKERAPGAECVNAHARNRGLHQFLVRGWWKVRAVLLWQALAHNLMRAAHLRAMRVAMAT